MDTIIMIFLVIAIIIIVIDIYLLSRFCQKFSWVSLEVTGTTIILCTEFFLIQSIYHTENLTEVLTDSRSRSIIQTKSTAPDSK